MKEEEVRDGFFLFVFWGTSNLKDEVDDQESS